MSINSTPSYLEPQANASSLSRGNIKSDFVVDDYWGSHNVDKLQEHGDWVGYFAIRPREGVSSMADIEMDDESLMGIETPVVETRRFIEESNLGLEFLESEDTAVARHRVPHATQLQIHKLPSKPPTAVCLDPNSVSSQYMSRSGLVEPSLREPAPKISQAPVSPPPDNNVLGTTADVPATNGTGTGAEITANQNITPSRPELDASS
ncbi:hypothetical protein DL98DRAFT_534249 [Cadophora sp. DSE1049]|nr:hypothetical protein DL98DRAFT_534249 [Cadophora sp. DSE1049]